MRNEIIKIVFEEGQTNSYKDCRGERLEAENCAETMRKILLHVLWLGK